MNLPGNDIEPWVFVYSVGLGQLAGMLMTRASFHARETTRRGVWFQIVQILFGAMVGLLLPVIGVVVITIVVMILLILANLWPVILLVWIYSIATRRRT
jgi:peptidoglycan biosynthesis protein MviN/MurJ (putative lipid II flippase)